MIRGSEVMFKEIFSDVIIGIVFGIISYLVVLIRKQISDFLNKKIENENIKNGLETANNIVEQAVLCVTQTYVDELKGKDIFDSKAQNVALQKAKDSAYAMFNDDISKIIHSTYGDFDEWLNTKIEEIIQKNK